MKNSEELYREWLSLQPLKKEDQDRLNRKFMLEFNYNSNHIEGNTLTYGQTEMLLWFDKVVDEANMRDLEEMKAHNVCLKMIREFAGDKERHLTETFIRQMHKILLREDYTVYTRQKDNINTSYVIHAGTYKTRPNSVITVTGECFEYASPEETPALMTDLVNWYNAEEEKGKLSPIELAALFHYRYIRIHPFEDGNGRIARLIVNYILLRHNYPMIIIESKDKGNYLTALNRCDTAVGFTPSVSVYAKLEQITPFVKYLDKCLEDALKICIKAAKGESIEDADDWKKNFTLKYKDKQNNPVSIDEKLKVLETVFQPLLDSIHAEFSDFYSLFASVKWQPDIAEYAWNDKTKCYYSTIMVTKPTTVSVVEQTILIRLFIRQFVYKIDVSLMKKEPYRVSVYEKEMSYSETLSKQDKTDIINIIGKKLNEFIESNDVL